MAARTGIGVGMGVTVTLLGLTSLTLFVLTFVFLSGKQNAERSLQNTKDSYKEFVSSTEITSDEFKKLASEAGAAQKGSTALGYLKGQLSDIRSIRLSRSYRAYYKIVKNEVEFINVERIDKHEY